jgi:hypothetical protein
MRRRRYYDSAHWKRLKLACHRRDGWRCTVPGCGSGERLVCDHIVTRPHVSFPTPLDVLANVRTLCWLHDRQAKERPGAAQADQPRSEPRVTGCDAAGLPLDPGHHWRV